MVAGAVLIVALWSVITAHTKSKSCLCLLQLVTIFLIIGLSLGGTFIYLVSELDTKFCDSINLSDSSIAGAAAKTYVDLYSGYIRDSDNDYGTMVDKVMCTEECKCYRGDADSIYNAYKNIDEVTLNSFGRTKDLTSQDTYQIFVWSSNPSDSFTNYVEC